MKVITFCKGMEFSLVSDLVLNRKYSDAFVKREHAQVLKPLKDNDIPSEHAKMLKERDYEIIIQKGSRIRVANFSSVYNGRIQALSIKIICTTNRLQLDRVTKLSTKDMHKLDINQISYPIIGLSVTEE